MQAGLAAESSLARALDLEGTGRIPRQALLDAITQQGLRLDDRRLDDALTRLSAYEEHSTLDAAEALEVLRTTRSLLERAVRGELVVADFPAFTSDIRSIFAATAENVSGKIAEAIPQLARVAPDQFGLALCSIDGQRFAIGDATTDFSVQSCTKVVNYCLALEELGADVVHRTVGREPSGRGYNELTLNKDNRPHNPMINAGAIATCALIRRDLPAADRFEDVMRQWTRLAGDQKAGFSNAVYLSEKQTADRNFALGYFMKEKGVFPTGTNLLETLEFYFQCCSIESTCEKMAVIAGTLANGGVCPITSERVLSPGTVRACLSLMSSCGLYDFSGEFAFTIGLPAKSGVSGALMVVVPNTLGLCVWSPRLDAVGNSVRGVEFCRRLVELYDFHNYDHLVGAVGAKKDPRRRSGEIRDTATSAACWAASRGDERAILELVARGLDLNRGDYDGRTALHLAASEGHDHLITLLLAHGASIGARDRWGRSALDDAMRAGHGGAIEILRRASGTTEGSPAAARNPGSG